MKRLSWWAITVVAGALLGSLGGTLLGELLYRFSYDYVFVPAELKDWGLRVGTLGGALLAAVQVLGPSAPASPGRSAAALVFAVFAAVLGCGIGAALGYAAYRLGWLPVHTWGLPNPSRHAMVLGVVLGKSLGVALGLAGGAVFLARVRGAQLAPSLCWGAVCALLLLVVIGGRESTLLPTGGLAAAEAASEWVSGAVMPCEPRWF